MGAGAEDIMRLVSVVLIVSGTALAMVKLGGTHTSASRADTQPITPPPSTSTVQLNAPVTTIVTLPAGSQPPELMEATFVGPALTCECGRG
jgi:hypothetical protein